MRRSKQWNPLGYRSDRLEGGAQGGWGWGAVGRAGINEKKKSLNQSSVRGGLFYRNSMWTEFGITTEQENNKTQTQTHAAHKWQGVREKSLVFVGFPCVFHPGCGGGRGRGGGAFHCTGVLDLWELPQESTLRVSIVLARALCACARGNLRILWKKPRGSRAIVSPRH